MKYIAMFELPEVVGEDRPKLRGITAVAVQRVRWLPCVASDGTEVIVEFYLGTADEGAFVRDPDFKVQERVVDADLCCTADGELSLAGAMFQVWIQVCEERGITPA